MGGLGNSSLSVAVNRSSLPDAVPTILAGALASLFVTGAEGVKKCPLSPVLAIAVWSRSGVMFEAFADESYVVQLGLVVSLPVGSLMICWTSNAA